jgi:hypothetical protein
VPGALLTDLYELNMAASYLRHDMRAPATFSLFVRNLPPSRGFLVSAGVFELAGPRKRRLPLWMVPRSSEVSREIRELYIRSCIYYS